MQVDEGEGEGEGEEEGPPAGDGRGEGCRVAEPKMVGSRSGPLAVYPFLHDVDTNQVMTFEHRHRRVIVPDVYPRARWLAPKTPPESHHARPALSLQHGDFRALYRARAYAGSFDAVVTNFFLDTAENPIEYMATIRHCLRPGGLWINHGPLQWHSNRAVMVALDELRDLVADMGFVIETERRTATHYGTTHMGGRCSDAHPATTPTDGSASSLTDDDDDDDEEETSSDTAQRSSLCVEGASDGKDNGEFITMRPDHYEPVFWVARLASR